MGCTPSTTLRDDPRVESPPAAIECQLQSISDDLEAIRLNKSRGQPIPYTNIIRLIDRLKTELENDSTLDLLIENEKININVVLFTTLFDHVSSIISDLPNPKDVFLCKTRLFCIWQETNSVQTLTGYCMKLYPLVENSNSDHFVLMKKIFSCLNNAICVCSFTKFADDVCKDMDFLKFMHERLKYISNKENAIKERGRLEIHTVLITIVYNLALKNIPLIRSMDFLPVLESLLDHESSGIRFVAVRIISTIINEKESKMFETHISIISSLITFLDEAVKSPKRVTNYTQANMTVHAETLALTFTQLARNDSTKRILVEQGLVPVVLRFVDTGSVGEKKEGGKIFLALAFDDKNQEEMANDKSLMECLFKLNGSNDAETRTSAERTLWLLYDKLLTSAGYRKKAEKLFPRQATRQTLIPKEAARHLMISYQRDSRNVLIKVKKVLEANGFRVWMDVSDMGGEVLDAMADAVEKARAILVCYSSKYKESDFCRMEAKYAIKTRKKLFFLKMEAGYEPDGWLGILIGDAFFYELTEKYKFEDKMEQLLTWIRKDANTSGDSSQKGQPLTHGAGGVTGVAEKSVKSKLKEVEAWTSNQVKDWLDTNQIPSESLDGLNGVNIVFLHRANQKASESFIKMATELFPSSSAMAKLDAISRLSKALEHLTDME